MKRRQRTIAAFKRNIGQEMIEGLTELRAALRDGVPLAELFDVRHAEVPKPAGRGKSRSAR